MMNEKVYKDLEYKKILDMLKEEAGAYLTKEFIGTLEPETDIFKIKDMLKETTEAVSVIMNKGNIPIRGFYDINNSVLLSKKGGVLDMGELLKVLFNMRLAENLKSFLTKDIEEVAIISALAELIYVNKAVADDIDRCIISENEMSDNAGVKLKALRRSIARQNDAIKSKLNQLVAAGDRNSMLQDSLVTMRQGRYVIPVKQEHRGKIAGIIHDQSQSGATLFVEPQIIIEMNNELRDLEIAEQAEIARILKELSEMISRNADELIANQDIFVKLDFIFAKGNLSVKMNAVCPDINEDGIFNIKKGRHPLIDEKKVVPVDISFGREYKALIITGPNTGGKTVTLKTVGLFVLMTQSGLHVPCSEGSNISIMDTVFADIGDEQSIEQNLSTFSSHMKNIVYIMEKADSKSLVLVDELGAGTDPQEGAALAIAVLDNLKDRGAEVLATTHYTELKKYALSKADVQNASMEFNVETLSPTYKLITGIPGKSNAFAISEKLGLSKAVIKNAAGMIDNDEMRFEEVISAVEREKRLAEEERDEAIMLNLSVKKKAKILEEEKEELEKNKKKIMDRAREEAADIVRQAKQLTEDMQRELKRLSEEDDERERNRLYEKARLRVKEEGNKYRETIRVENRNEPISIKDLKVGDKVRILTIGQTGTILSLPDSKGDLKVQAGTVKISLNVRDIAKMQDEGNKKVKKKAPAAAYSKLYKDKSISVGTSVSVIGKNLDEALMEVEKYIDDAYMAGLNEITIIHGRGKGILRDGIADMLRRNKHVEEFNTAGFHNGGTGATEVKLK